MKPSRVMVVALLVGALVSVVSNAALAGKKESGKELYKEYCKPCHLPDSDNGEYTPMTLIQEQWERFFDEEYTDTHGSVMDEAHGGKPVTQAISEEHLAKIRAFAIDHAADSENPMTCG